MQPSDSYNLFLNMTHPIPVLNVLLSLVYLSFSCTLLFVLKRASTSTPARPHSSPQPHLTYGMVAKSWFKKYSLLCSFSDCPTKYLMKECLIISTFAVACFNINHIILWPVTFALFIVPLSVLLLEVLIQMAEERVPKAGQGEGEVKIENVGIEVEVARRPDRIGNSNKKTSFQMGVLSILCFTGAVLSLQCLMNLIHSVSNSGELNLLSLLSIILLDQFLMRPTLAAIFLASLKALDHFQKIDIQSNIFISELCREEIKTVSEREESEDIPRRQQITSSPFKGMAEVIQEDELRPSEEMFIDFDLLQPYVQPPAWQIEGIQEVDPEVAQETEPKHQIEQEERESGHTDLEKEAYLTTPEKEMFEQESEENNPTIVHTYLEGKENYDSSVNCSKDSVSIKEFEDFILGKTPLQTMDPRNRKGATEDLSGPIRKGHQGRRKNRRELRMGGPSPYLQYLPNMLKKVQKFRHIMKETREPQRKML